MQFKVIQFVFYFGSLYFAKDRNHFKNHQCIEINDHFQMAKNAA